MSILNSIKEILNDDFKFNEDNIYEENVDASGKRFRMQRRIVTKGYKDYVIYKFDSDDEIFPFFKKTGVTNLKKICDYVIFIQDKENLFIYLIELKLGNESAKKQLEAAQCFCNYLLNTISRLKPELGLNSDKSNFRLIKISERRSNKRTLAKGIEQDENGIILHSHNKCFFLNQYIAH